MNFLTALKYANRIVELLQPHCHKIDIAGSISRCKYDPDDVEIVCLPKKILQPKDFFQEEPRVIPEFDAAIKYMMNEHISGDVNGRMMKFTVKGHVKVDMFMPEPEDYYRILAIRTGSATYSHLVLAHAWKSKGWVGTDQGLRRRDDCFEVYNKGGKSKWKVRNHQGEKPPVWQSEQELFQWLGLQWIDPRQREIKTLNTAL